jgi:hypothetical protein
MNVRASDQTDPWLNPIPIEKASRRVRLGVALTRAGVPVPKFGGIVMGPGESAEWRAVLHMQPGRVIAITRMRSAEGVSRTLWLPIRQSIPE